MDEEIRLQAAHGFVDAQAAPRLVDAETLSAGIGGP
jgi:hypothetical protein